MAQSKKSAQGSTKKDREDVGEEAKINVDLGGFGFGGLFKGIGNLIDLVQKMEKEGKSIHRQERTVLGKSPSGKEMRGVYGFSVRTGLGGIGKPRVEPFGNIRATKKGPVVEETREPLVDVFEEKDQVVVIAEMPGSAEEAITTRLEGKALTITATSAGKKQYYKVIELPCATDAEPVARSYKNGVLELKFNKKKRAEK